MHRTLGGPPQGRHGVVLADDAVPHRAHGASIGEPLAHRGEDVGGHGVGAALGGDGDPVLGVGGGHRPEALEHALVEGRAGELEAVELAAVEALCGQLGRGLDVDDQRRPMALHRPLVDAAQVVEIELAAVALVGEGRIDAAIADHGPAGGERRDDHLGEVLGAVGGHDQRLGARFEVIERGVVEDGPQPLTDGGAARLLGEHRAEGVGEAAGLRRLAAALGTFEGDVRR